MCANIAVFKRNVIRFLLRQPFEDLNADCLRRGGIEAAGSCDSFPLATDNR